jgi:xanthine dehydrogenase small subunit
MPIEENIKKESKDMRNYLLIYINGKKHTIKKEYAKKNLSEYLRENLNMKGTKVVCSEGDCGASTVLVHRFASKDKTTFETINSCISPLYLLDCCHIISVEGIEEKDTLHPVQEAMAKYHGTQCGFCTPGIVNALVSMGDSLIANNEQITEKKIKNFTTGNLCRCTGYKGIINAGLSLNLKEINPLFKRYHSETIEEDFINTFKEEVELFDEDRDLKIVLPKSIKKVLELKTKGFTITSGGTDIGVLLNKGYSKSKRIMVLTNVEEFYELENNNEFLVFSPMITLSEVEKYCEKEFVEFSNKLKVFASPQIKNKGTLIGNIANGSPIGDSIPFLYVSGAILELTSLSGSREVLLSKFYLAYKQFDLKADEIITKVKIPKSKKSFKLYKVSARKDLDISAVSLAVAYVLEKNKISDISIAYGGVAGTVYKAEKIEQLLWGKELDEDLFKNVSLLIPDLIQPLSDHRASKEYRIKLCQNLLMKFYNEISSTIFVKEEL